MSVIALALVGVVGTVSEALAQPSTKTMYTVGRGSIQVIRIYDAPDPLGKTVQTLVPGNEVEVYTDELHNKYWYKTTEGHFAHSLYLSETNPLIEAEERGDVPVDRAREDRLMQKYRDIAIVNNIMVGNVQIGWTQDMVVDAWGDPDSRELLRSDVQGDIWMWLYDNPERKVDLVFDHRQRVAEIRIRP